jgi:hypothetical protein
VNPIPRNPFETRCSVPGCRAWAIRGSDPPICSPHRSRKASPDQEARPEPGQGACAEPSRGARPERKRGVGARPGNQNHFIHGFYATSLPPDEQARLLAPEGITSLDAEIALTRAALDCIYEMLTTGVTPGPNPQPLDAQDYARFIGLAFRGTNTVARLLSTRMALGGRPTDAFSVTVDKVLDELGAKWGIDL